MFLAMTGVMAQIPVGYNHAPNGELIYGIYHPFLNSEYNTVNVSLDDLYGYEKGFIKLKNTNDLEKVYINFKSKKIKTEIDTTNEFSIKNKYKFEEVEYFKQGTHLDFFLLNFLIAITINAR